ncbi:MAG TPA: ABC transporter permease, partial [Clostridia bacterium]|nr:ABC transporter permease [Clostridia bacterium]
RIEHKIPPESMNSLFDFLSQTSNIALIILLTLIMAGSILAVEFSSGTIKLLAVTPYRRWKILYGKYAAVMIISLGYLLLQFICLILVGLVFFGTANMADPYLSVSGGQVVESSYYLHVLSKYLMNCVSLVMIVIFAFMISSLLRNNAVAIGLSLFIYFIGSGITQFMAGILKWDWGKYLFFANTDLTQYFDLGVQRINTQLYGQTTVFPGMSLAFSITVLVVYFIVFHAIAWLSFTKRDITG